MIRATLGTQGGRVLKVGCKETGGEKDSPGSSVVPDVRKAGSDSKHPGPRKAGHLCCIRGKKTMNDTCRTRRLGKGRNHFAPNAHADDPPINVPPQRLTAFGGSVDSGFAGYFASIPFFPGGRVDHEGLRFRLSPAAGTIIPCGRRFVGGVSSMSGGVPRTVGGRAGIPVFGSRTEVAASVDPADLCGSPWHCGLER
jgi:hypothetical protein